MMAIRKTILPLIVLLALASTSWAQPVAKIIGPSQVPAGELTALSSTGSTGDNLLWVTPDGLATIQAGCELLDQQIFFSTTREGVYEFLLIVADKSASIAYAKHVVTVGKPTQPPPQPPPVDPPPTPTPGKWNRLVELSKQNADSINDQASRAQLKAAIHAKQTELTARCAAGQCPGLDQCKKEIVQAIEFTLLNRTNRFAAWDLWRKANQQFIEVTKATDTKDYLDAIKAIASGL